MKASNSQLDEWIHLFYQYGDEIGPSAVKTLLLRILPDALRSDIIKRQELKHMELFQIPMFCIGCVHLQPQPGDQRGGPHPRGEERLRHGGLQGLSAVGAGEVQSSQPEEAGGSDQSDWEMSAKISPTSPSAVLCTL